MELETIETAANDVARASNRRVLLNLIRTRQPLSRADLARVSGFRPRTVSSIVQQLIEERWVVEGPTAKLPAGRRPTLLKLNGERMIVAVTWGPLETIIALSDLAGRFSIREAMAMPPDPRAAIAQLCGRIRRIVRSSKSKAIEGVGISLPGHWGRQTTRAISAPNLNWTAADIGASIAKAIRLEVELDSAANACALGTMWFDHTEDCRGTVVVTVSEGIGAGILAGGQLVRGLNGMAGEFGHVSLDPEGPPCACGGRGCWEAFASNRAALRCYLASGAKSQGLTFVDLLDLADQGEASAVKALETMAHFLGRGMRMIVAGIAPKRILVIGDLTRSWHRFGPVIEAEVAAHALARHETPRLIPVLDGEMARLRGAVALVLQKRFGGREDGPAVVA